MRNISDFNQQVAACQDEAYTLAWYLLGDAAQAEAVVQAAVASVFHSHAASAAGRKPCRLSIFQAVVKQSQRLYQPLPPTGSSDGQVILEMLQKLPYQQRQALVLVDILDLSYPEAAAVIGLPGKDFSQRLAQARRNLADCEA